MHHLDMPFRSGAAKVSGMPSDESLGKAGLKGRGEDFNGISKPQEGDIHRRGTHVAHEPIRGLSRKQIVLGDSGQE
jgi:hypothetical protein